MTDNNHKSNKKIYNKPTPTQELILDSLYKHGNLGINELAKYSNLNRETVRFNCRKLVKQRWIYDRGESQKGKYSLVEQSKIPAFLTFRAGNRSFVNNIIKDIFSSITNQDLLLDFTNKIGIYILYVIIESLRPDGLYFTTKGFKTKDPRMQDIDLLGETWITDTLDPNFLIKQFKKYINNLNHQELLKMFESTFPEIYNKIKFHQEMAEMRRLKKHQTKKKKQKEIELDEDQLTEEEKEELITEIYDHPTKWIDSVSKTKEYYESLDTSKK